MAETLNLSGLAGYRTGGTVHVVINNQLGFTTAPEAARSSVYPTDVAKMVQAPIFHVNGDDPEACARAARLAFGFRQAFHKDVVIDMVCYRRHGHNEGDDPSYTQPLMYALIDAKRSVRKLYTEALVRRGDISLEEAEQALDDFSARLQAALDETRAEAEDAPAAPLTLPEYVQPDLTIPRVETGIDPETVGRLATVVRSVPEGFVLHPKLARQFEQRDKVVADGEIDWALGEALAFGSLLLEGTNVRVTGQDTRRGTFSHRHAVLVDHETGVEHVPLEGLEGGRFTIRDSLLSEYACVGFEYGYSVEAPNDLVAWEAQFGDFWNGAEIIVDNFLVAAEDKWGQKSGLVLLLPHGYEGQGPEHSSARIERFLTLCARGNLRVTEPTTAAQYFHLLRAQVRIPDRKPLDRLHPEVAAAGPPGPVADRGVHLRLVRRGARRPGGRCRGLRPVRGRPGGAVHRQGGLRRPGPPGRAGRRPVPTWPWSGSSSSTRGRRTRWPRCCAATRRPRRWCGCRRSPRTWAPGTSSTAGCTGCCATRTSCATSAGPSRPARPRAAPRSTGSSRRTCWSGRSAEAPRGPAPVAGQARKSRARAIHISVDRRSDSTSTRSSIPWNMAPYCSKPMAVLWRPNP